MIGTSVSHYRIIEKLGQGGMGEVYLAEDTKLGRKVALKFLPPNLWHEPEAQARLLREARAASRLDHPHIVTIHGIEESEGRPFIQMAYVSGTTLDVWCRKTTRSNAEILALAEQMADALRHAHAAGIVHRDLKPGNVLVDEAGRARILDFGIASLHGAARLTQTGMTLGTLAYVAPEIAKGQTAEPAADIYSLGVVLYEMLAGAPPFTAEHDAALLYAILHTPPPALAGRRPGITSEMQAIVMRCLEKEPRDRYPDCAALLADLRKARAGLATAGPATDDKPSIAVLPFANMSADPENEYFSDGLSEELLNVLAKNTGLKVTGRTSSFAFKGRHEDLREIGQKLGVATLLEGSVRKAGNRVRITAQLVKASDGFHLWSETYDRVLDDIFAVQDDIAKAVSSAMNVTLLGAATATTAGANAASYDLVLQAKQALADSSKESLEKAVRLYHQAIERAPDDARAWAGLSLTLITLYWYGHASRPEDLMRAREAADRAMTLDDTIAEAHYVLAWMLGHEYDWEASGREFHRAFELAPGDGRVIVGLATYEGIHGNTDESLRLMRRAMEIEPLSASIHAYASRCLHWAQDYEGALAASSRALELSPNLTGGHGMLALLMAESGNAGEALSVVAREPSAGYRNTSEAIVHHALGNAAASDAALAALKGLGPEWAIQIVMVHASRGEVDAAFEWMDRAIEIHDPGVPAALVAPTALALHADPRWPQVLERVGLAKRSSS